MILAIVKQSLKRLKARYTGSSTTASTPADLLTEEEIAQDVYNGLGDEDFILLLEVKTREDMIQFHHSAGRHIRNHYKLWERTYTPVIIDGVDCAEDHPDAISARILERVWDKVHKK